MHDAMTCASYLKFAHTKKSIAINEITGWFHVLIVSSIGNNCECWMECLCKL